MRYFYTIQCTDKKSGRLGDFVYADDNPFYAISPVFDDLTGLYFWIKENGFVHVKEYFNEFELRKLKWLPCGLCHGTGRQKDYDDEWDCPPCEGTGGSYID